MRPLSSKELALAGMAVVTVAILALAGLAWVFAQQTADAASFVAHSQRVKGAIRELEASLYRAEAGQRALLATRDVSYRRERNLALDLLDKGSAELGRLTSDDPQQAERVSVLRRELSQRVQLFRQGEALVLRGGDYSAQERIEIGAQALGAVRPLIDGLTDAEDHLLAQREQAQRRHARITVVLFLAFAALLLLAVPLVFWRMARDAAARQRAEVQVAEERAYDAMHARALTLYNAENQREAVLQGTLSLLAEKPQFSVTAYYAHEEWGGDLRLVASHGVPAEVCTTLRLDGSRVGSAAREGHLLYVDEAGERTTGATADGPTDDLADGAAVGLNGLSAETGLAALSPASMLVCPVRHHGRLLGVLVVAASAPLTGRDQEFIERLCAQLGEALHNLGQLEDLSLLAEQLHNRSEDIQRKNAELERANRMKSEFLANMSHELRTPLNAIIGFSEIMKDGLTGPMPPKQREYLTDIHTSGKHLLALINDILDLSRVELGQVNLVLEDTEPWQIAVGAQSLMRERAGAAKVSLGVDCPSDLPALRLDARKTKQIVFNLLANALKFTPEGGSVSLEMEKVSRDQVLLARDGLGTRVFEPAEASHAHYLEIRVKDNGIGIAPEDLARLFQAFVQIDSSLSRQYTGTGLGLTIVRRLTELQGGGLMVRSVRDGGSVFTVWLPWREAAVPDDGTLGEGESGHLAEAVPDAPPEPDAPLVLVVEDDPRAASLIQAQLRPHGYRVRFTRSAEDGLEMAAQLQPAALVLDIVLPGMDGWEMLARLKERDETRHIPVVITSITDEARRGFALGAAQVLVKPVVQGALLDALAAAGLDAPEEGAQVLVVDDDPKAVALVSEHIEAAGYVPLRAYGGQEAMNLARNAPPALVVLDLTMPQVSGFDVVRGLRAHKATAEVPIIVLTSRVLSEQDRELLHGQVQQVMEKTDFHAGALVAEVKRAMAMRRRQRELSAV